MLVRWVIFFLPAPACAFSDIIYHNSDHMWVSVNTQKKKTLDRLTQQARVTTNERDTRKCERKTPDGRYSFVFVSLLLVLLWNWLISWCVSVHMDVEILSTSQMIRARSILLFSSGVRPLEMKLLALAIHSHRVTSQSNRAKARMVVCMKCGWASARI